MPWWRQRQDADNDDDINELKLVSSWEKRQLRFLDLKVEVFFSFLLRPVWFFRPKSVSGTYRRVVTVSRPCPGRTHIIKKKGYSLAWTLLSKVGPQVLDVVDSSKCFAHSIGCFCFHWCCQFVNCYLRFCVSPLWTTFFLSIFLSPLAVSCIVNPISLSNYSWSMLWIFTFYSPFFLGKS